MRCRCCQRSTRVSPADISFVSSHAVRSLAVQGTYSIERLLALEEYTRSTPVWRVAAVILATPVFPATLVIVYQMLPLQPVAQGWRANWVFFVGRMGGGMVISAECFLWIMRHIIPETESVLSVGSRVVMSLFVAAVYVVIAVVLAEVWAFPVPFIMSIANVACMPAALLSLYFISRAIPHAIVDSRRRVLHLFGYACLMPVLTLIYPAYMSLFLMVDRAYRPLVTPLVPVMKIVLRKAVEKAMGSSKDLVPVMVVFSIEFFSSLYLVICVQSGDSTVTTIAIMALDLSFTLWSQWKLHKSTQRLQRLLKQARHTALLPRVCALCEDAEALSRLTPEQTRKLQTIRLRSPWGHSGLSVDGRVRLQLIAAHRVFFHDPLHCSQTHDRPGKSRRIDRSHISKVSVSRKASLVASPRSDLLVHAHPEDLSEAIVEATTMLFRTELLLLTEYLECVIPWMYAANLVALWLSPNGAFYSHIRSISSQSELSAALLSIGALFVLEIASFVLLNVVLWKRLQMSPLYQLSYVLEQQATVIQANMAMFLVIASFFNLDHTGTDFSFRFKWLQQHDQ